MTNIKEYFNNSAKIIETLSDHESEINQICEEIVNSNKLGKKILVAGNGGSCSDSEHFVGELQCTYKKSDRKPYSAFSLSSLPAALTAWSNDFGFNTYFKRQVQAHGKKDDILFIISTGGGNEKNGASMSLVEAVKEAQKNKLKIFALLGKSGGLIKGMADVKIIVKSDITSHIQEAHIAILHCICEKLESY